MMFVLRCRFKRCSKQLYGRSSSVAFPHPGTPVYIQQIYSRHALCHVFQGLTDCMQCQHCGVLDSSARLGWEHSWRCKSSLRPQRRSGGTRLKSVLQEEQLCFKMILLKHFSLQDVSLHIIDVKTLHVCNLVKERRCQKHSI